MTYPITIYASALLVDEQIKFWNVTDKEKKELHDWKKDFILSGEDIVSFSARENYRIETKEFTAPNREWLDNIFTDMAPDWFNNWLMVENYKGIKPYKQRDGVTE